jgi:uncharacterized phage protein (TIGR02218 family)
MSSFLEDERSIEQSRPREGVEILLPAETIRIATGTRNITIDGNVYTAAPSQRAGVKVAQPGETNETQIVLPATHPFVRRYVQAPPRVVLINVWRKQLVSNEEKCIWRGYVAGIGISSDGLATFTVPLMPSAPLKRTLPMIAAERSCVHTLYGNLCAVDPDDHKITTAITFTNGNVARVASMGAHASGWATFGRIVHVASGESVTLVDHVALELTLRSPIYGMKNGDAVEVFAGCDLQVLTCRDKFDNVVRFGGFAAMPKHNPFTGIGIALV